jgi:hypothetical protein
MGGGFWSSASYNRVTGERLRNGTTFGYDAEVRAGRARGPHPLLDPSVRNAEGRRVRESRDSAEHPLSTPIVVGFDSTGSMGSVPRTVQRKLATLFELLVERGYATDPQVCIATYGDAVCDRVPLQIGQFESDNRIDENLDRLYLEGGGGGNGGETSQLLMYYLAHHTATDAWDKRGKRGYLFLIADEVQVPISKRHVRQVIGDRQPLGALDEFSIARDVSERWDVKILLIDNWAARTQHSRRFYAELFGSEAIVDVEDPEMIAETIAAVVGVCEGRGLDEVREDLEARGAWGVVPDAARPGGAGARAGGAPLALGPGRAAGGRDADSRGRY